MTRYTKSQHALLSNNPYINFMREFRKKHPGLDFVNMSKRCAAEWQKLSKDAKCRYYKQKNSLSQKKVAEKLNTATKIEEKMSDSDLEFSDAEDSAADDSIDDAHADNDEDVDEDEKSRNILGTNPFLNFMRDYRKVNRHMSFGETARRCAQEWKKLPKAIKKEYIEAALEVKQFKKFVKKIAKRSNAAKKQYFCYIKSAKMNTYDEMCKTRKTPKRKATKRKMSDRSAPAQNIDQGTDQERAALSTVQQIEEKDEDEDKMESKSKKSKIVAVSKQTQTPVQKNDSMSDLNYM